MKVCGVVVLYNPDDTVLVNIQSYIDEIDKLIVVDNSNEKGLLLDHNEKILYRWMGKNVGLAAALNYGCNLALEMKFDYVLTMDQDSFFDKGALRNLKEYLGSASIVAPNVRSLYWDNKDNCEKQAFIQYPIGRIVDKNWVMTSGCLMNLSDYEEVGGFDEKLFIGHIDIDVGIKLRMRNKKIVVVGDSILNQHFGNSQPRKILWKTVHPSFASPVREYYIFRNQVYLEKKYGKKVKKFIGVYLWKFVVKAVLFEDKKLTRLKMMIEGVRDGKNNVMGVYSR